MTTIAEPPTPSELDAIRAGLQTERLQPDSIIAFFGGLGRRSEAPVDGFDSPAQAEAFDAVCGAVVDRMLTLSSLAKERGHAIDVERLRSAAEGTPTPTVNDLTTIETVGEHLASELSTIESADWISGRPTMLDHARDVVVEITAWLRRLQDLQSETEER